MISWKDLGRAKWLYRILESNIPFVTDPTQWLPVCRGELLIDSAIADMLSVSMGTVAKYRQDLVRLGVLRCKRWVTKEIKELEGECPRNVRVAWTYELLPLASGSNPGRPQFNPSAFPSESPYLM